MGALAPALLTACGNALVPTSHRSEPALTHYPMPYDATILLPGPALERAYDELALLAALQGIVNRDKPRLYVKGVTGADGTDVDTFWWQKMASLGWSVAKQTPYTATDLNDLLAIYGRYTKGLCVWDPAVPATQNVAATVAGVSDLLPVAYRTDSGSLYMQLRKAGWGVGTWLVNQDGSSLFTGSGTIPGTKLASSGSAKNDAYLWAKERYLDTGKCDPALMAYYIDAYWLQNPAASSFYNNTLVNHDYYVANRGFFFDLDPWSDEAPVDDPNQKPGTDTATLKEILASANQQTKLKHMINVGGFVPWAFKYTNFGKAGGSHAGVPTEWEYAEILSWYNAFMEADALSYSALANASFTQHFPLQRTYPQPAPPTKAEMQGSGFVQADGTVAAKRFFAFYVGDFDSPAWLYQNIPSLWTDPNRGKVPLSWAFDPNLCLRAGPAMAWTRATRSSTDVFVAGDSGAGYLNPGGLQSGRASGLPSGVDLWASHCARFYKQWDIQVTGFIIDGNSPAMDTHNLEAYAGFSPGGIVGQKEHERLVKGMPVLTMTSDLGSTVAGAVSTVEGSFTAVNTPQFAVTRAVLQTPTWYKSVADQLTADGIEVVDLVTLMRLVAQYLQASTQTVSGASTASLAMGGGQIHLSTFSLVKVADAAYKVGTAGGVPAVIFETNPVSPNGLSYLYLSLPHGGPLLSGQPKTLWLQATYYDAPAGMKLLCEYNSSDTTATRQGAYTPTSTVTTGGTDAWKTVVWMLPGADFTGAQNNGADLRLDGTPGLAINQVTLTATQPTSSAGSSSSGT